MTAPQIKFAQLVGAGMNQTEAYRRAYPKCSAKAAESKASRLVRDGKVKAMIAEIQEEAKQGAVLTLKEKREFLARVVRIGVAEASTSEEHKDLIQAVTEGEKSTTYKLPDKLRAIQIDNDLAGEGSDAEGNAALGALVKKIRGGKS